MASQRVVSSKVLRGLGVAATLTFLVFACIPAHPQQAASGPDLYGTEWTLVKFEGANGVVLVPEGSAAYTVTFAPDQRVNVHVDCNRGQGTWNSKGPNEIEFAPLVLTWAQCVDTSIDERMPGDFAAVRTYALKDDHLFLYLKANGGAYEFAPQRAEASSGLKEIKGTVFFRERMALPPDAELEMTLEDTSKADAPVVVVARTTRRQPGNPPIEFAIPYDSAAIDAGHSYAVRARILADDKPLFISGEAQPVFAAGAPAEPSLLLRLAHEELAEPVSSSVSLEGTHWKLTKLKGFALPPPGSKQIPWLTLEAKEHRISGFNGCNRLAGSYTVAGNRLTFGTTAATAKACLKGMDVEHHFNAVLSRVAGWKVEGQGLDLLDSDGSLLASFEVGPEESSHNPQAASNHGR